MSYHVDTAFIISLEMQVSILRNVQQKRAVMSLLFKLLTLDTECTFTVKYQLNNGNKKPKHGIFLGYV